ncbi:MAG: hypothetical protein GC159_13105 [Phycisphaera sp.]|nr:hypothetical protein [Phycisphaera sp.]
MNRLPTPTDLSIKRRISACSVPIAVALACLPAAYYLAFTTLMDYDDEGHQLQMLSAVLKGVDLYAGPVRCFYGPVLFLWQSTWAALGMPVSHAGFHWLAIFENLTTATLIGYAVLRVTGRIVIAIIAEIFCLVHLAALIGGPGHAQGLVCLMMVIMVISLITPSPSAARWAGACAAILILCKINSGVFAILELGFVYSVMMRPGPVRSTLLFASTLTGIALPVVLMRPHLALEAPLVISVIGGLAMLGLSVMYMPPGDLRPVRLIVTGVGCSIAVVGLILVVSWLTLGLSPTGPLLNIFAPQRMAPQWFWLPDSTHPMTPILPLATTLLSMILWTAHRRKWLSRPAGIWVLNATRVTLIVIVGIYVLWYFDMRNPESEFFRFWRRLALRPPYGPQVLPMIIGPLSWLLLAPRLHAEPPNRGDDSEATRSASSTPANHDPVAPAPPNQSRQSFDAARVMIVAVTVINALYIYPVSGPHLQVSTLFCVIVAAILLHDTYDSLAAHWPRSKPICSWITATILLMMGWLTASFTATRVTMYDREYPLALKGSGAIRLSEERVAELQWVAYNLRANSSIALGAPGRPSIGIWANLDTPRPSFGNCPWLWFPDSEQEKVIDECDRSQRLLAFINHQDLNGLQGTGFKETPLGHYFIDDLRPVAQYQSFRLLRRPGDAAPRLTWQGVWQSAINESRVDSATPQMLLLRLPALPRQLAGVTIGPLNGTARFDSRDPSRPITFQLNDRPAPDPTAQPISLTASQTIKLLVACDTSGIHPDRDVVRLFDPEGRQFGSVPVIAIKY